MSGNTTRFPSVLKLPMEFDVAPLQKELELFQDDDWIAHWNTKAYRGAWTVLPFYAVAGHKLVIYSPPVPGAPYAPTEHLKRAPEFARALDHFHCEFATVRLMSLDAGASIEEHTDEDLCPESGEVRLHIPIRTTSDMEFVIDGIRAPMAEGELWYGNFTKVHRLHNPAATPRIHLVIDCKVNDWLLDLLRRGTEVA